MRFGIVILATFVATAQAAPDDRPEQEAILHLNLGIAAYKAGHYNEALRELTETDRLAPDRANTHRWLALVQAKLGDCKAALVHVDAYMARVAGDDKRLPEIIELRDRCLGSATLVVTSKPAGATIRIDGAVAGTTPHRELGVHGGSHVVTIESPGFTSVTRSVALPGSGELAMSFTLEAVPTTPVRRSRWWLWAAGAAALATAAGVTYAATRDREGRLPPIVCGAGGCQ